ncbi:MAG: hypothetical protein Q9159_005705 [Coniocarpon cinnabarinum]
MCREIKNYIFAKRSLREDQVCLLKIFTLLMDPLSIAASTLTFITFCHEITRQLRLLREIRRAPQSIGYVCDEVDSLNQSLAAVHIAVQKRQDDEITPTWRLVLGNVESILNELKELCSRSAFNIDNAKSARKSFFARHKWVTDKGRVENLRSRLHSAKLDLSNQLAATNLCACHQQARIKTPSSLNQYVGSLLIKSSGLPGLKWACTEAKCKRRSHSSVQISYRFPEWFLNRMVSTIILSDQLSGPQCALVPARFVRNECDLFYFAKNGNIDGIKKLFSDGAASKYDVASHFNYTALHYAVDAGQVETAQFLVKQGAHTDVAAANEETPADLAWNKICNQTLSSAQSDVLAVLFEKETWLEDRHLSTLHKLVLDLLPSQRSLKDELEISTTSINALDSFKRTPLSWAAEIGNEDHVRTLLEYGANPEISSVAGFRPLHYAAQGAKVGCMQALLDHHADVSAHNEWGQHALNITCYFSDNPECARVLLDGGADIDEQDTYESSALSTAAFTNRPSMLHYLLERGAAINNVRSDTISPLDEAVSMNSHECISILLRRGASITFRNMFDNTLLHTMARRADLWTMELFANQSHLPNFDVTLADCDGNTAQQLFDARGDEVTPYMRQLFNRIASNRRDPAEEEEQVDEEEDGVEVFHDMLDEFAPPLGLVGVSA